MRKYLLALSGFVLFALQVSSQATVLNSQNFGNGFSAGWAAVDNNGNGEWQYYHNPINTTDYLPEDFNSTTAANGFAVVISDGNQNPMNTDLRSPAINCSTSNYVGLQFEYVMGLVSPYPTAQVWVSTDGTSWNMVFDALENATGANPQLVQLDISSYAALQPTVYIKFNYQATDNVFWAVDDISILSLASDDAVVSSVNGNSYAGITNNYPVQCTIQNVGGPLTGVTMNYYVDNGPVVTEQVNSLNLATFQTLNYLFNTTAAITTPGLHTITVFTSAPNGDTGVPNDSMSQTVSFFTSQPVKNVFIEEFATAVCGFCPGGALYLDDVLKDDGAYTVAATHHSGYLTDAMTLPGDETLAAAFTPPGGGAPEASIDRVVYAGVGGVCVGVPNLAYIDQDNPWDTLVQQRHPFFSPLSISASNTYNDTTRELNVTVSTTVYGVISGDFRVNCYVVEDSIVTDETGYAQVCYYCEGGPEAISDTSINPYYLDCTYSSANGEYYINGYVDNHVVRDYLGGTWGSVGVIPATTAADSTYTVQYTATLSNSWRANKVSLVAFAGSYNANYTSELNQVFNVVSMPLNGSASNAATPIILNTGVSNIPNSAGSISLYPNPASDYAYLRYNLTDDAKISFEVYNALGQTVYSSPESSVSKGSVTSYLNTEQYPSGLYLVNVKEQGQVLQTLKFIVSR